MKNRIRTYTFLVECPLPATPKGEARSFTAYVHDVRNKYVAESKFWLEHLATARKNGLRGPVSTLEKTVKLTINRLPKALIECR